MSTNGATTQGFDARGCLERLLTECVQKGASDVHLSPGLPPHFRVDGELVPGGADAITPPQTRALAVLLAEFSGAGGGVLEERLQHKGSLDGALSSNEGARFRFNLFQRQREIVIVLRRLEDRFRSLAELGLPDSLYALCDLRDGLVIVSGPTGAGKSTTLATLIDRINRKRHGHIVTIEDPIEYLHRPVKSVVNQRQIGMDAPSFNDALVAALRQDPDVILVGEVRDVETIRTAITAAETGHLVLTTLHAGDCVSSIERLTAVFPAAEQEGIRRQLALVLRAIVAQHLLPGSAGVSSRTTPETARGAGTEARTTAAGGDARVARQATSEVLMVNPAVANLIGTGKSAQIYSLMETGHSAGMQTLEQDLARLWAGGKISEAVAVATARNVNVLRSRVAMLRKRAEAPALAAAQGGAR